MNALLLLSAGFRHLPSAFVCPLPGRSCGSFFLLESSLEVSVLWKCSVLLLSVGLDWVLLMCSLHSLYLQLSEVVMYKPG